MRALWMRAREKRWRIFLCDMYVLTVRDSSSLSWLPFPARCAVELITLYCSPAPCSLAVTSYVKMMKSDSNHHELFPHFRVVGTHGRGYMPYVSSSSGICEWTLSLSVPNVQMIYSTQTMCLLKILAWAALEILWCVSHRIFHAIAKLMNYGVLTICPWVYWQAGQSASFTFIFELEHGWGRVETD